MICIAIPIPRYRLGIPTATIWNLVLRQVILSNLQSMTMALNFITRMEPDEGGQFIKQ
ncbi:hypothetical protein M472_05005 [Sphingobacterium paucimobilis HER1398]|uniref:Uncharacterized protein n=1 Tax=Sphingobacterium paucimobilis HER1398 TaxID=1346330 RepID=U2J653_9SPHI|nr:hypothetical protein M472_05005 [Sphingobacterium paucimobilis HER1398]